MRKITERQREALLAIKRHIFEKGFSPSMAEIARRLRITESTATAHVAALRDKGFLEREPGKRRAIKVIK